MYTDPRKSSQSDFLTEAFLQESEPNEILEIRKKEEADDLKRAVRFRSNKQAHEQAVASKQILHCARAQVSEAKKRYKSIFSHFH